MPDALQKVSGTTVAFGDVVQLSKERSKDPEAEGFERYLGLEHLEPSDLKVRSWGDTADGTTFTTVFKPGQVLFGKRRAYQRKVAVAEFSGVCSGDIYVLEPKGNQLLPELLPFICQSEPFYDYVISMSQGGLSPRVNWKALAKYEFALPPLLEQRRLARALGSNRAACAGVETACARGDALRDSLIVHLIERGASNDSRVKTDIGLFPAQWDLLPLGERYEIQLGKMMSPAARSGPNQLPYMRNANVQWNRLDLSDVATMSFTERDRERFSLRAGDILACEGRHVGKSVMWRNEIPGACYQKALHRLRPLDPQRDTPEFMLHCLRYYSISGRFIKVTGETTIPHLPADRFRQLVFPFPPRAEQDAICQVISSLDDGLRDLGGRAAATRQVMTSLMTQAGDDS